MKPSLESSAYSTMVQALQRSGIPFRELPNETSLCLHLEEVANRGAVFFYFDGTTGVYRYMTAYGE